MRSQVFPALTRRASWLVMLAAALTVFMAVFFAGQARAAEGDGLAVVAAFHASLIEAMKGGEELAFKGREAVLAPVVEKSFDITTMSRAASGAAWREMSDEDKARLENAFRTFMTANFASNFKNWSGHEFVEESEAPRGARGLVVRARLIKPDGDTVRFDYLLRLRGEVCRIVDLVVDGKVSEVAKRRAEFAPTLQAGGAPALIAALDDRTLALAGGAQEDAEET